MTPILSPNCRRVLGLVRWEPRLYARSATFWILWHAWALLPGLLAQAFFNALAGHGPFGLSVGAVVALAALAGAVRAAMMLFAASAGVRLHFRVRGRLQQRLIRTLLRHPAADPLPESVGELVSTARDDADRLALAMDWPFDAAAGLIFWGLGIGILLSVDARLTLTVFLPLVAVVALAHWARARVMARFERRRQATADVTGLLWELLRGRETLVAGGAEARAVERLSRANRARRTAELSDRRWFVALDAIFSGIAQLGAGATLLMAAGAFASGRFTVGDFALFAAYLTQVAHYIGFVGYLLDSWQEAGVAIGRLDRAAGPKPVRPTVPTVISASPLTRLRVVNLAARAGSAPVSFVVPAGSLTVITGGTGRGKTTLLLRLMGLTGDPPPPGTLWWNDVPIDDAHAVLVPPRAAAVPEHPHFLDGTVRDNILVGRPVPADALWRAVNLAALAGDLSAFPDGLDTPVGEGGHRLSGGQATRVAVARAVLARPALLIADSLSAALDAETERRLWDGLLAEGMAILAVSNRPQILRRANVVVDLGS